MKKIINIIILLILSNSIISGFTFEQYKYNTINYSNIVVRNMADDQMITEVDSDVSHFLLENQIEMFTTNSKLQDDKTVIEYYSNFADSAFYVDYFQLK